MKKAGCRVLGVGEKTKDERCEALELRFEAIRTGEKDWS
jgi:hypothetical protein